MTIDLPAPAWQLFLRRRGIVQARELDELGIDRVWLRSSVEAGELTRLAPGLYVNTTRKVDHATKLAVLAAKYPKATFCLETALHLNGYLPKEPAQIWIALPRGGHAWKAPLVRFVFMSDEAMKEGVQVADLDGIPLRSFNLPKTIVDCFRYRKHVDVNLTRDILRSATFDGSAPVDQILRYAKVVRVERLVRSHLAAFAEDDANRISSDDPSPCLEDGFPARVRAGRPRPLPRRAEDDE